MAYRTNREHFERLVERSLESMPEEYTRRFENITVLVEDRPSAEDAEKVGVPRDELMGLFDGVAYPDRGGFFEIPAVMPDRIILYRKNIEEVCSSEEELIEEIRKTLVHEVGHYFGFSEEELDEYE